MIRNFQGRANKHTQPKLNDLRFLRLILPIIYRLPIIPPMVCEQMILFGLNHMILFNNKSSPQGAILACVGFRA